MVTAGCSERSTPLETVLLSQKQECACPTHVLCVDMGSPAWASGWLLQWTQQDIQLPRQTILWFGVAVRRVLVHVECGRVSVPNPSAQSNPSYD